MSKKNIKRICDGKKKYKSFSIAEYDLFNHKTKLNLHVYKCPFCKSYHIGRKPNKD